MIKKAKKKAVKKKPVDIWSKAKYFVGLKEIGALPMNLGAYNKYRGWTIPSDEDPKTKGYIVKYPDGYISWSPKQQFEDAYMPETKMDFSAALFMMKKGVKIARKGWNGKKQFVFYVPANSYPASGNKNGTLKGMFPGNKVPYAAYAALKNAQNKVVPWVPSEGDLFAEDWCVVK